MTPVKNQLTGIRATLKPDANNTVVFQNNVEGEIYIAVNNNGAWIKKADLLQILDTLYPTEGKHVKAVQNGER